MNKRCSKCGEDKELENFYPQKYGKFGRRSVCNKCVSELNKKYRSVPKNKEQHRLSMKQWRDDNREAFLSIQRRSYQKNGAKQNGNKRLKYKTDADYRAKIRATEIRYKESGRRNLMNKLNPKHRERSDKYKKDHPEQTKKYHQQYRDKKYREVERWQRFDVRDGYVIKVIKKQTGFQIKTKDITHDLIELKRESIKLKRELKNQKS